MAGDHGQRLVARWPNSYSWVNSMRPNDGWADEVSETVAETYVAPDPTTLEGLWARLNDPHARPTPNTTVEAIMWCVRERGVKALQEPRNIERLSRCDPRAKT